MMPIEFEYKTLRIALQLNMTLSEVQKDYIMQLNALDELRKMVVQHTEIIQHQRAQWHDKYIKERKFKSRDWALIHDSRYKDIVGKLQTRWLGPYEIDEVFPNGAVRLTTIDPVRFKLLVNGHRLCLYHKPVTKEQFLQQFANQVQTTVPATSEENPLATVPAASKEDIMDAVPAASAGGLLGPQS
ncbi:uncharacterized protein LOC131067785 [Cryptomeria japonica]|uniref:uncharacterized protein LOC131067785 n=1 Tax=Cryptomeria japonica TaxID=3369 RepID=UPI0027D9D089|nr:uncharacterized protein LOC131067785 [Cryptomeria japonica]